MLAVDRTVHRARIRVTQKVFLPTRIIIAFCKYVVIFIIFPLRRRVGYEIHPLTVRVYISARL